MAAFFHSRGILRYISEWRRFFTAGVFSAIYPSGGVLSLQGCSLLYIRVVAFLITGCSLPYIPVAVFFHSRGDLCHIPGWRRFIIAGVFSAIYLSVILFIFLIAGVFSAIYPSGGVFS